MRQRTRLDNMINTCIGLENELTDLKQFLDLSDIENDKEIYDEVFSNLIDLSKRASKLELQTLFSGEADNNDCYLEVHAGAGGTESQDWAEMLLRMYKKWCDTKDFKFDIIAESIGEEAGIKSATVKVSGYSAYGWLKGETGVHRLVRISPFDSSSRRHTSFASIGVYPVIDDEISIQIDDKDLRIDTYRSSGAGGQHVNTTDSAVRITHLETGIVVQCQSERSQHKNKSVALKMLKSRLYEIEIDKIESKRQENYHSKSDIGWGHQIRSYVLHPYQLVKDLRTGVEKGNALGVLEGDIDEFIETGLSFIQNKNNKN
ncbi:MAG: Peptide chain release factor 2 [Alphaproteobacteria bacterium MarineAlpha2_Bin1]|nr:MAG: Peptide chain release factor 2 [Alphaproteobacteria bacterium MarineAlpha2_Bin1]